MNENIERIKRYASELPEDQASEEAHVLSALDASADVAEFAEAENERVLQFLADL